MFEKNLKMTFTYHVKNMEVLHRSNRLGLQDIVAERWSRFTGHLLCKLDDRHAKRNEKYIYISRFKTKININIREVFLNSSVVKKIKVILRIYPLLYKRYVFRLTNGHCVEININLTFQSPKKYLNFTG